MNNEQGALDAERAVIGACLLDAVAADRAVEVLVPGDFLEPNHRKVFAAISTLALSRQPIDIVTVRSVLPPELGFSYVAKFQAEMIHGQYVAHHAQIVLSASLARALATAAQELRDECENAVAGSGVAQEIATRFASRVDELRGRLPTRAYEHLARAEPAFMERVQNDESAPRGLPTGFHDVDEIGNGLLRDGEMIVLAARPSVGKSLFSANIVEHLTFRPEKTPCLLFSMEMSASAIYRRFLFGRSGVGALTAMGGSADLEEKRKLQGAHYELSLAPWYVHDECAMTPHKIHAMARRFQSKHGKGLIVIDYLGLMNVPGTSIYERVTEASRAIKGMAADLKCPVLALCQLNRNVDKAGTYDVTNEKRVVPNLSDLRDSGAIEQDADVVMFLARNHLLREQHLCDVIVAKNRSYRVGRAQVLFDTSGPRFKSLARVENWTGQT